MSKNNQYEELANDLTRRIKSTKDFNRKCDLMVSLGHVRFQEYIATQDPRADRLRRNCYNAALIFEYKARGLI